MRGRKHGGGSAREARRGSPSLRKDPSAPCTRPCCRSNIPCRGRSSLFSLLPESTQRQSALVAGLPILPCKDRKSTRLNSSQQIISYAVFCLKKKTTTSFYMSLPPYRPGRLHV